MSATSKTVKATNTSRKRDAYLMAKLLYDIYKRTNASAKMELTKTEGEVRDDKADTSDSIV